MEKISFYADERIRKAIEELAPRSNVGQFLRTAIHFYLDNHEAMKNIERILSRMGGKAIPALKGEEEGGNSEKEKTHKHSRAIDNILSMGGDKD